MSTTDELSFPVAVLMLPKPTQDLLLVAQRVHDAMEGNPYFPSPNPPLSVFAAHIGELADAHTKAASRAKGTASFRDVKKKVVKDDLFHQRDYVQGVVEASQSGTGAAIIESACMSVRKTPKRSTPEVSAKNGDVSGKVLLAAKSVAAGAVYAWEYSADQSAWTPIPETLMTRTEVSGLKSACLYSFRFRALTRAGWQDYSHVVSLVVH